MAWKSRGNDHVEKVVLARSSGKDGGLPKGLLVCRPTTAKRSVGGQRRCNDLVMSNLRKCKLLADWREMAQERAAWRGAMKMMTRKLNDQLEASAKKRKDEQKMRREEGIQLASTMLRWRSQDVCLLVRLRLAWSTTLEKFKDMAAQQRSSISACSVARH